MPVGPGKHDHYCTLIREETGCAGVAVITFAPGNPAASGFSVQADIHAQLMLPDILEHIAGELRATFAKGQL
jgi:hypothetical protein